MLNLLKKTKPWMVASLLVATSAFGQSNNADSCNPCKPACPPPKPACPPPSCCKPCPPPREPLMCPTIPAYNAPARWETRCPWDVWVDASFIYWQPFQDNMEPAAVMSNAADFSDMLLDDASALVNGKILNLKTKFKPGFKVGIGMNFDHDSWDGAVEYTRFHSTHSTSGSNSVYYPMLLLAQELEQFSGLADDVSPGATLLPFSFKESWRLNMDFIDVDMGRWYWVGTALSFRPSVGARGGWINQRLSAQYGMFDTADEVTGPPLTELAFASISLKTRSWCVGPRMGINTNWMVGGWGCNMNCWDGFRFIGNAYADILYTRYKTSSQNQVVNEGVITTDAALGTIAASTWHQSKINTIRTHLDLELGLGWGSYFDNNNWHFDLSATYGFQVFFSQNMFRNGASPIVTRNPVGDLYIQGLTLTARLDF